VYQVLIGQDNFLYTHRNGLVFMDLDGRGKGALEARGVGVEVTGCRDGEAWDDAGGGDDGWFRGGGCKGAERCCTADCVGEDHGEGVCAATWGWMSPQSTHR
jgi:hypothetical protein